jgi:long-chain acyl-CoA synthetase
MGANATINYAVPVTHKVEGESAIYRFPDFRDKLFDRPEDALYTMKDVLIHSAHKYAQQPALGTIIRKEQGAASIDYVTYGAAIGQAREVGSGIIAEGLFSEPEGERLRTLGIFSKNRVEWTVVDMAACLFGLTTVPIYDTLGDENITYVLQHAQLTACFVDNSAIKALIKCKDLAKATRLICFDAFSEEEAEILSQRGIPPHMKA